MKKINSTLGLIFLLMINLSFGQEEICTTFERGGKDGWKEQNANSDIKTPGKDGSRYLEVSANSANSYIYNSISYPSNWKELKGKCLCLDYKIVNDGYPPSTLNIHPEIILFDTPDPTNFNLKAVFTANITVTENSDWVRICAPIMPSNGQTLPGNAEGQWGGVTPAQWDDLLTHVGSVAFSINVGGPRAKAEIIGVDNICIEDCNIKPPSNSGAYCCDGENFVTDGNFESNDGSAAFITMYDNNPSLFPGSYQITNTASAFGASVTDHSYCEDPSQYPNNNRFMVVNGKTQQSGNSVIWAQNVSGLIPGASYRFCAHFKNLPQCTFDILPNVSLEVTGAGSSGFSTISADPNDPCDWKLKDFVFTAPSSSVGLRIVLDETGNGDGNDLAIDDISVSKLDSFDLDITVQHQGNPQQITASINTIDPIDDYLPNGDCDYYWFVAEVNSFPPLDINWNSLASGNDTYNDTGNGNSSWNLTTTFPDYIFNQNTLYVVGMYLPECECYESAFTYQLTLNNRPIGEGIMSEEQKQRIIDIILNGRPTGTLGTSSQLVDPNQEMRVYPNPTNGSFNISLQGDSLKDVEIYSVTGQPVYIQSYSEGKVNDEVDVSAFATGIYFIKARGIDGKLYNAKLVKE